MNATFCALAVLQNFKLLSSIQQTSRLDPMFFAATRARMHNPTSNNVIPVQLKKERRTLMALLQ
jgi:hypothetical protein